MRRQSEGVPASDAELYFGHARSWDQDRQRKSLRSERIAWGVAVLALLACTAEALALAGLAPLKTIFVTGIVHESGEAGNFVVNADAIYVKEG